MLDSVPMSLEWWPVAVVGVAVLMVVVSNCVTVAIVMWRTRLPKPGPPDVLPFGSSRDRLTKRLDALYGDDQ